MVYLKCTLEEIEELVSISRSTFKETFEKDNTPEDFEQYLDTAFSKVKLFGELSDLNSSFYFVYRENVLVGYFKLNVGGAQSDLNDDDAIELERIYVKYDFQGKGVGCEIIAKVKQLALNARKSYLWLGVWEKNVRAISFYKGHGFVKFGRHPYFIGNDKQMDWLMKFDLNT